MISIITPSYGQLDWLRLCIASVADQTGVEVEHIVQDAGTPGIEKFLQGHFAGPLANRRLQLFSEKDAGMYDAVNRGYRRASGDIFAYLNCDEQYLPGALKAVEDFFRAHPDIEVAFAGSIITDAKGRYLCHRHLMLPHRYGVWFRFPVLTSSVFIRRRVALERGICFNTYWRDFGDFHWVLALLKHKVPMAVYESFTSVFTDTGDNMNLKPNALREKAETDAMMPGWVRPLKPLWILHHRLRRLAAGHFSIEPMTFYIYTLQSPEQRVCIYVPKPTAIWRNRL